MSNFSTGLAKCQDPKIQSLYTKGLIINKQNGVSLGHPTIFDEEVFNGSSIPTSLFAQDTGNVATITSLATLLAFNPKLNQKLVSAPQESAVVLQSGMPTNALLLTNGIASGSIAELTMANLFMDVAGVITPLMNGDLPLYIKYLNSAENANIALSFYMTGALLAENDTSANFQFMNSQSALLGNVGDPYSIQGNGNATFQLSGVIANSGVGNNVTLYIITVME
jgi:hypothetical protein